MADVGLVDVSLRDGNQSLWGATGLGTGHVLQVAPLLERVGFRALDYSSSTAMGVAVRVHREDPWERHPAHPGGDADDEAAVHRHGVPLHLLAELAPGDHAAGLRPAGDQRDRPGRRPGPDARHGRRPGDRPAAQAGRHRRGHRRAGLHDQRRARRRLLRRPRRAVRGDPNFDRVYVKDPAGILTAERARTLLPALRGRARRRRRWSCTRTRPSGCRRSPTRSRRSWASTSCRSAAAPLGNGSSLPEARRTVANLREMGHRVDVDDRALGLACDFFDRLAVAEEPAGRAAAGLRRRVPAPPDRRRRDDDDAAAAARDRHGGPVRGRSSRRSSRSAPSSATRSWSRRSRRWWSRRRCST